MDPININRCVVYQSLVAQRTESLEEMNIDELFKALKLPSGYSNRFDFVQRLYDAGVKLFTTNMHYPDAKTNIRMNKGNLYIGQPNQNEKLKSFLIYNKDKINSKTDLKNLKIPPNIK